MHSMIIIIMVTSHNKSLTTLRKESVYEYYSAFTETGATQKMKTNQMAEPKQ